jgi:hypothetical protein
MPIPADQADEVGRLAARIRHDILNQTEYRGYEFVAEMLYCGESFVLEMLFRRVPTFRSARTCAK